MNNEIQTIPTTKQVRNGFPGWKLCSTCFGSGVGLEFNPETGADKRTTCKRCHAMGVVQRV